VNFYSASSQNNASNALDVPSTVQRGTSSARDESSRFACPVHANCHGTLQVPCRWSSDSEDATAVRVQLKPWNNRQSTVHSSPYRMPLSPITRQRLVLPHELAHCVFPGWGQLVNVALLPLTGRVWVYVALLSSRMNSSAPLVGRPDRVTRESGRVDLILVLSALGTCSPKLHNGSTVLLLTARLQLTANQNNYFHFEITDIHTHFTTHVTRFPL